MADTNDSSGSISHLVIAEAGRYDYAGMTLNSVGSATDIKYVQVSRSNRDGLVIAGGNANLRNIVLTTQGDHSLDISSGFSGSIQHLLIKQEDWNTGAAINYSIEDETAAALANVTIVGDARRPNNDAFIDVSSTIASESESIADPLGLYSVVTTTTRRPPCRPVCD